MCHNKNTKAVLHCKVLCAFIIPYMYTVLNSLSRFLFNHIWEHRMNWNYLRSTYGM